MSYRFSLEASQNLAVCCHPTQSGIGAAGAGVARLVFAANVADIAQRVGQVEQVAVVDFAGTRFIAAGGARNFPNAELIFPKVENDHWAANPSEAYTANVAPLVADARQIADGEEVLPGIRAEAAYGHTPGHTAYLLESDGQRLLVTGDTFNHYVYSVQHPEWHVRFDMDKDVGAATRTRVLARLAEERIPCIGYHMPFPALAFIAPNGEGSFRYVPATYQFAG